MRIPMVDLTAQYRGIKEELDLKLSEILSSGHFILGPNVEALEDEIAAYIGVKHAVAVASGTDALHLALLAAGVGPGDLVITTPFTFIATAEAISYTGATPVFADVEERTFNIAPKLIEKAVTKRTKAIIPVHLFGHPARMDDILDIANTHGLAVIEDCAQGFGAHYKLARAGSFGDMGCFSFFPSKNLGCYGDGGMITTDSGRLAENVKTLRNHGSRKRYHHDVIGYNSRLDEVQAGVLRVKLKRIDAYNASRRKVARLYNEQLAHAPGITTPAELKGYFHVYHQYTILAEGRDAIVAALAREGVASAVYYPVPLHLQGCYTALGYKKGDFPVSERLAGRVLSLPMYPELPQADVELICKTIRDCVQG